MLDRLAEVAPREMRRAWTTAFGNAKLAARGEVQVRDLPQAPSRRAGIGFVQ